MLRHSVLRAAIAGVPIGLADDGTISLADAVQAINKQATKFPETRDQSPLTEEEIIKSLENFSNPKPGPDEQYRELDDSQTRIFKNSKALLRLIVCQNMSSYDNLCDTRWIHAWNTDGGGLIRRRQNVCPFSPTIREESAFHRPFTQKERQFEDEMQRTGFIPTMSRVAAYFDDDPKLE